MKLRSILAVIPVLMMLGLMSCSQPLATTSVSSTTNNNGGTYTVIGQISGQVVDDTGAGISGATVSYNAPQASVSMAIAKAASRNLSKAMTTITTDSNGNFTASNLQTGVYIFTVIPPTTTVAGVTTVNNMAGTFTVVIPTLAQLTQYGGTASGSSGPNTSSNRTYVNTQKVALPRITGSITGYASLATLAAVPKGTVLTMDFGSSIALNTPNAIYAPIQSSALIGLLYPTFNSATSTITTSTYATATTADATGKFVFSNLPLTNYGPSTGITGYGPTPPIALSNWSPPSWSPNNALTYNNPIIVNLGQGTQISSTNGGLLSFALPAIPLGYDGSTPSLVLAAPCALTYTSFPTLALVSTSTTDQNGFTNNNPATTASIVLTFNNPVLSTLPNVPLVDSTGTAVLATLTNNATATLVSVTVTGPTTAAPSSTITIAPASALNPSTSYTVNYKVLDGKAYTASTPLSGSFTFGTLTSTSAPVAVSDLAPNPATAVFNSGTTSFPVSFTYNTAYTYTAQYAVKPLSTGVQSSWAAATISAPLVSGSGSIAYATISNVATWNSGDTVYLRLVESFGGTTALGTGGTSVSNVLTITDQVAPSAFALTTKSGISVTSATPLTTAAGFGNTFTNGNFTVGQSYTIASVGNTNFAAIGAAANFAIGTTFTATGAGGVNGTAFSNVTAAGNFIIGQQYTIATVGTTLFTAIGSASNTVGTVFTATGVGSGSGTAWATYTASSFIVGQTYTIASAGTTNFTLIGAANNFPGTIFTATGAGSGTGTVTYTTGILYTAGNFMVGQSYTINLPGTTNFTTIGAAANTAGTVFIASAAGGMNGTALGNFSATQVFNIALNPNEVMSVPTVVFGSNGTTTSASGATITIQLNATGNPITPANTVATVTVQIPTGKTIIGDTLVITLKDGAGKQYLGAGTGGTIVLTIN